MFESDRLILRKLNPDDLDAVYEMRCDPDVMRYIREPQTDRESSVRWIEMMTEKWDEHKIGFCAVVEKSSDEFVGWCGLWELMNTDEIEVGYAIAPKYWGKGYATEAARRCLEYGFDDLGLERIVAVAYPKNTASQNVMRKIGMKYVKTGEFYEKQLVQFAISREKFNENR